MAAGLSVGAILGYLQIQGAAQADQDILRVQQSMDLTAGSATRMGEAIGETEVALTGAGRASGVASTASSKLRAAQLSVIAAQERYNTLLADGNASTARLASAEATLIRANDRLTASALPAAEATTAIGVASKTAATGAAGLTGALGRTVETAAKLGLALGAFELLTKAVDEVKGGVAFQKEMLLVQTQAGASAAEVKELSTQVLALAGPVATAPEALATSLYHAKSVGLDAADALNVVKIAAEGAQVGNADLEETTNALTAAVASGIPGVQNMSQAMGALNTIVGAGDMKLSDLNDAMGSGILVVSKQFGLSLTDVGAALATFGDNNIRGANAATMLRVSITSMAKPVAGGVKQLEAIGISANQLAEDMQKGGLNQALVDLSTHLTKAGITGDKVGEVLTTAFGKKAGPGISVLVDQLSRFQTKVGDIESGAGGFADDWTATTKTASFAFKTLGAEAQVAGIKVFDGLEGPVTSAAVWLGTSLPNAINKTQTALHPMEQELGAVLVPAWQLLSKTLEVVVGDLSSIGNTLAGQKTLITVAGTTVLGMWAAWKGYTIVSSAAKSIAAGLSTIAEKAAFAKAQIGAVATGENATSFEAYSARVAAAATAQEAQVAAANAAQTTAVDAAAAEQATAYAASAQAAAEATAATNSVLAEGAASAAASAAEFAAAANAQAAASQAAAAKTATASASAAAAVEAASAEEATAATGIGLTTSLSMGVVGVALAGASLLWMKHSQAVQQNKEDIQNLTDAIKEDSGALGDNVKAVVAKELSDNGMLESARHMGLSLSDVTDAVMGSGAAMGRVDSQLGTYSASNKGAYQSVQQFTGKLLDLSGTTSSAVQKAKDLASATGGIVTAQGAVTAATVIMTQALQWQIDANGNLVYAQQAATDSTSDTTTAMDAQTAASKLLKQSLDQLNGVSMTVEQTQDDFTESLLNLSSKTALAKDANGKLSDSLSQTTLVGVQNREMITGLITSANAHAQAVADQVTSTKDLTAGLQAGAAAFAADEARIRAAAAAAGLNKQQIDAMITSLGKVPNVTNATVKVDTSTVAPKIAAVQTQLVNLHNAGLNNQLLMDNSQAIGAIQQAQARLNALTSAAAGGIHVQTQGLVANAAPPPAKHATGGTVVGAGTGTSDSNLIMASAGEEIIAAKPAAKFRPLLKAINADAVPGFASGGTVSASKAAAAVKAAQTLATQKANIKFTITTDVSKVLGASTTSALMSAVDTLTNEVHTGIAKGIGSKSLVTLLQKDNAKIGQLAQQRTVDVAVVAAATSKLQDDEKAYAQEKSTVSSAVTGGFNLGSIASGLASSTSFDAFGGSGPVSASTAGILAALKSQVSSETDFDAKLGRLKSEGLNASLLQQLGEAGVSGAGQAVDALFGGSKAQIGQVNALFGQSQALGGAAGSVVAGSLFGSTITADTKSLAKANSTLVMDDKSIAAIAAAIGQTMSRVGITVSTDSSKLLGVIKGEVTTEMNALNVAAKYH